jgi:hypothetical protein
MPIHTELASWQALQPPVMPEWIWVVVGTGVAKAVPGAVAVALAGICPGGTLPKWQVSQVVFDGMCDVGPTGEVGGMRTMLVIPKNVVAEPEAVWHATQLLVMPAWLMREPENRAPLGTGVAATLEPAPTWQVSQGALVGMWLLGGATIEKPAAGIAKLAAAVALWHCAQLPVVLCALA